MSNAPTPADEAGQALIPSETAPGGSTALDAHGYDPGQYEWVPVLRKPRKDGWTPQRQVDFIAALADTGCVMQAAAAAGMSERSCYRLRRESPQFAAAWEAAVANAASRLVDLAFDRAIHGSDEPVFDKEGNRVGRRMRHNDRLLMFLLRAYRPDRFRHAHQSTRTDAELPAPATPPIAEALLHLQPVEPDAPHLLMPPEELDIALECADMLDGNLSHIYRGRGDAEPAPDYSLGPEFERMLEDAKRKNAGWPLAGDREKGGGDGKPSLG